MKHFLTQLETEDQFALFSSATVFFTLLSTHASPHYSEPDELSMESSVQSLTLFLFNIFTPTLYSFSPKNI